MSGIYGDDPDQRKPDNMKWFLIFDCWVMDNYSVPFVVLCAETDRFTVDGERIYGPYGTVNEANRVGAFLVRTDSERLLIILECQRANLAHRYAREAFARPSTN